MSSSGVVIVSQFGAKAGGTPGNYIRRYTSRLDATEALLPYTVSQTLQDYERAYMERNDVAEQVIEELGDDNELKLEDQRITDQSARLFGNEGLVYSREQFSRSIRETEKALEEGHTLITPVVSFSHEYLQQFNVVPEDMSKVENDVDEGAYFGKVDQLKLRRAITKGMDRLCKSAYFVEPVWTAAVQVDTANVHVHVTLIESADVDKVPKERYVHSPKQEMHAVHTPDGSINYEYRPVLDASGNQITENLGERGKLQPRALRGFREGVEQEFIRMKVSKPFTNDLSAHTQLVKQHSTNLSLEHTVLSSQLVQIYEALPKHDGFEPTDYIEHDRKLRSEQRNWRAGSNRQSMRKPNELAYDYVDRLISDHRQVIGYDAYEQALDEYVETKAPDLATKDNTSERERLKKVVVDRLREEMVNGLYRSLKPLRVVDDVEAYKQDVASNMDDRERIPIEGQLTPKGLQLALLDDEQLKDLIADELVLEESSLYSSSLSMEKRLRDHPVRYRKAKDKKEHYDRLKDGYDRLSDRNETTDDSIAMRDLYVTESEYYKGIEDKYAYLIGKRQKSFLEHNGTRYPLVDDSNYNRWVDQIHPRVVESIQSIDKSPTTEATQLDLLSPEYLPDPILESLQQEAGDVPLVEAIKHDNQIRHMSRTYNSLHQQMESIDSVPDVSVERFNDVKAYDLIETIYDFDAESHRTVSSETVSSYKSVLERRDETFRRAFAYLEDSNQNTSDYPEYAYYQNEYSGVQQALEFAEVVDRSGSLPNPLRRHHKTHESMEDLEGSRVIPASDARDFNVEFLSQSSNIVSEESKVVDSLTQEALYDESFDLTEELIRLNNLHMVKLIEEEEQEEAQRLSDSEQMLLRDVPLIPEGLSEGELDLEFARSIFKKQELKIIPRYVASYYETSYDDPGFDIGE